MVLLIPTQRLPVLVLPASRLLLVLLPRQECFRPSQSPLATSVASVGTLVSLVDCPSQFPLVSLPACPLVYLASVASAVLASDTYLDPVALLHLALLPLALLLLVLLPVSPSPAAAFPVLLAFPLASHRPVMTSAKREIPSFPEPSGPSPSGLAPSGLSPTRRACDIINMVLSCGQSATDSVVRPVRRKTGA